jgi:tRNA(Ile)-lysidine synthase TilS/MesJ
LISYPEIEESGNVLVGLGDGETDMHNMHYIARIKRDGQGKRYDSILGLSGGVDSSYLAYLTKKFELRPLVVHLDNGWNSELAVKNIENIVKKLNFDLYTYVIDWEEFKDLQRSFFKASVVDIEMLTDHAIFASLYQVADKRGIEYILIGTNIATEVLCRRVGAIENWILEI